MLEHLLEVLSPSLPSFLYYWNPIKPGLTKLVFENLLKLKLNWRMSLIRVFHRFADCRGNW